MQSMSRCLYQHAVYVEMLKRSDVVMLLTDKFIEHSSINSTNSFDTFYYIDMYKN